MYLLWRAHSKNSSLNVLMSSYSWCNTDGDETTATTGNNYF